MGKDSAGPFFPPFKMFWSFYLSSRLLDYVIFLLYLNSFDLYQAENQVFNSLLVLQHFWVEERLSLPILSPLQNVSIILFIFLSLDMLLFHCIWTLMFDLFQIENLVFKPTSLLVLLHCRVGKDWGGPIFPPSKMFLSFYLSFSLLDYVTLWLYLNNFEWRFQS